MQGKTGEALTYFAQRHDREVTGRGIPADIMFRHADFGAERPQFYATMNQLCHNEKKLDDPYVSKMMWEPGNRHNKTVPYNTQTMGLTSRKTEQWQEQHSDDRFKTTTRVSK